MTVKMRRDGTEDIMRDSLPCSMQRSQEPAQFSCPQTDNIVAPAGQGRRAKQTTSAQREDDRPRHRTTWFVSTLPEPAAATPSPAGILPQRCATGLRGSGRAWKAVVPLPAAPPMPSCSVSVGPREVGHTTVERRCHIAAALGLGQTANSAGSSHRLGRLPPSCVHSYRPAQVLTRLPRLPRAGRAASAPDQDLCGLVSHVARDLRCPSVACALRRAQHPCGPGRNGIRRYPGTRLVPRTMVALACGRGIRRPQHSR